MTRDDFSRFRTLGIDFSAIGLEQETDPQPYFCTPEGAEWIGSLGCDGVHFVLLPGEEAVFCVDPEMGEEGTFVLPVGENFRRFLSYLLFCRNANVLAQIHWMNESQYRELLEEDQKNRWPGCEEIRANEQAALEAIRTEFHVEAADAFAPVKALQSSFDSSILRFSDAYYEVLGLERI